MGRPEHGPCQYHIVPAHTCQPDEGDSLSSGVTETERGLGALVSRLTDVVTPRFVPG